MTIVDREAYREYHRNYYYKRRARMIALLGDRCVKCGSKHQLQFDHIDPEQKSFDINDNMTATNPAVLAELAKCQLLCADCHREKTARDKSGWTHGTMYGYQRMKCRCDDCRDLMREVRRRYRKPESTPRERYGRPADHGDMLMYRRGCRCDLCREASAAYARELRGRKAKAA